MTDDAAKVMEAIKKAEAEPVNAVQAFIHHIAKQAEGQTDKHGYAYILVVYAGHLSIALRDHYGIPIHDLLEHALRGTLTELEEELGMKMHLVDDINLHPDHNTQQ